jgi:Rrf2 family iron-responsive transcriptional regulator
MLDKRTSTYALLVMYEIARQHRGVENPPSVRLQDIVSKYKLPQGYLGKMLSWLVNAELLDSARGPRGGYCLNRPMKDITFYDIFDSVGALGPMDTPRNPVKGVPRSIQVVLNNAEQEAVASVKDLLCRRTLADLFKSK